MNVNDFSKRIFIFSILFIFLLSITCVYSEENVNTTFTDYSANELSVYDDDYLSSDLDNNDLLGNTYSLNGGKFSDIQNIIDKAKKGDTIQLTGSFTSDGKQINIDKKLTISSLNGATLNGKDKTRIFNIESKAKGTVIKNIIFKNGYTDKRGGAIYLNASKVTLDKCTFQNCAAHSGGAIATPNNSNADSLTVTNSKFLSNHANYVGGAMSYIAKKLKISDCIFESNYLKLTSEDDGGSGGVLQVGITNANNKCKITNCLFNNNYVIPYNDIIKGHAGVGCLRRDVTFSACNFTNNYAHDGGVLTFHDGGFVINCRFISNYAIGYAGAIQTDATTQSLTISQSVFEGNIAEYAGTIALIDNPNVNILETKFINNTVKTYGGAIWSKNSKIIINNCNFSDNYAVNGSAIYNNANLTLINSTFADNCAKSYKLLSNNITIAQGETAVINVYLEYGDNYPGIYSTNSFKIDNNIPILSSGALNQIITLTIFNNTYVAKTNSKGIATFNIKTENLNPKKYNFTLKHEKSTISTGIINNYILNIIKKSTNNSIKKTKKTNKINNKKIKKHKKIKIKRAKKSAKKHRKNNKKGIYIKNKTKYKKLLKKIKKSKSILSKHLKSKSFKKVSSNSFLSLLTKNYSKAVKFLNSPIFTIPGYAKTLKSWGLIGEFLGVLGDFFLGINSKGQLTVGNLVLNLLSLACGAGLYIRGAKLLSNGIKLSKYLPKLSKFISKIGGVGKYLKRGFNFIKKIPAKFVKKTWKTVRNIGKSISHNKYLKKVFGAVKNLGKNFKNIPNTILKNTKKGFKLLKNTKNKLFSKFTQIRKSGIQLIKKGTNYLSKKAKVFLNNFRRFKHKVKPHFSKFNKVISKVSGALNWLTNPRKKVLSNFVSDVFEKYSKNKHVLLKSKGVSTNVKSKVYKSFLKVNSIKTYYFNPIRKVKVLLFPDTKSIKKNVKKWGKKINKINPIKRIFKPRNHTFHSHSNYRRVYSRPVRRFYPRRQIIRQNPVRRVFRPVVNRFRSGINRVRQGFNRFRSRFRFR